MTDQQRINRTRLKYGADRNEAEFIIALEDGETDGDLVMVGKNTPEQRRKLGLGRSILDFQQDTDGERDQ